MPGMIGSGVSLQGIVPQDFIATWNVTGAVTAADVGNAVALDTSASNSVKLAGDDTIVLGILASYENRVQEGIKVGAIATKGFFKVPYVNGATALVPIVGHSVKGSATAGAVKPVAAYAGPNTVVAVDTASSTLVLYIP